jgi:hypothetical protein
MLIIKKLQYCKNFFKEILKLFDVPLNQNPFNTSSNEEILNRKSHVKAVLSSDSRLKKNHKTHKNSLKK